MDGWMDGWIDGWTDKQKDGQMDGRTDGWTDGWKILPFYRTLSPIGATALVPPMKTGKSRAEQGNS